MMISDDGNEILSQGFLAQANQILQLETPALHALEIAAASVREHEQLSRLAVLCSQRLRDIILSQRDSDVSELFTLLEEQDSFIRQEMGYQSGMFRALLFMMALPYTVKDYRVKRMEQGVLIDTMSDFSIWMRKYYDEHGRWGLSNLRWLINHLTGKLYRLGRLQFIRKSYSYRFIILRSNEGTVALSEDGVVYRRDGLLDGTNRKYDRLHCWTATFQETADAYIGHPVNKMGQVEQKQVILAKKDWDIVLRQGSPVLDIHIAENEKLSQEKCRESMLQAISFYETKASTQSFQAFVCSSWLMDPQFQLMLPSSSNIVKFQRDFYLLPIRSDEYETYERVFGTRTLDIATAPRDTSLRRAIIEFVEAGNLPRAAAGILLKDTVI